MELPGSNPVFAPMALDRNTAAMVAPPRTADRDVVHGSPAHLRLVIRDASDILRLRNASKFVPRLPRSGIRVFIDGLAPEDVARLEDSARRYIRACGCGEGAVVALTVLCAAIIYEAVQLSARQLNFADLIFGCAALAAAVIGSMAAKFLAIRLARRRFEKCCDDTITLLSRFSSSRGGQS